MTSTVKSAPSSLVNAPRVTNAPAAPQADANDGASSPIKMHPPIQPVYAINTANQGTPPLAPAHARHHSAASQSPSVNRNSTHYAAPLSSSPLARSPYRSDCFMNHFTKVPVHLETVSVEGQTRVLQTLARTDPISIRRTSATDASTSAKYARNHCIQHHQVLR